MSPNTTLPAVNAASIKIEREVSVLLVPVAELRLARLVKIKHATPKGEIILGSGHLLASGLVLTASHVLRLETDDPDSEQIPTSELLVRADGERKSRVVSRASRLDDIVGNSIGPDAVLLTVPGIDPPRGTITVGANFESDRSLAGCSIVGYPDAGFDNDTNTAPPEWVDVELLPISGARVGKRVLQVMTPPPKDFRDWGGISGASVLDPYGRLLGIVVSVPSKWDGTRLTMIPIDRVLKAIRSRQHLCSELKTVPEIPIVSVLTPFEVTDRSMFADGKIRPPLTDLEGESFFNILHYHNRVVPFVEDTERSQLRDTIKSWARTFKGVPEVRVLVLEGPAGSGKSRLAVEICHDLLELEDEDWQTGFVDYFGLIGARPPVIPLLAVCDYPEREPELLGAYISQLWQLQRANHLAAPARIVVIARHAGPLIERLRRSVPNIDTLIDHRVKLRVPNFDSSAQIAHLQAAFKAFLQGFGRSHRLPSGAESQLMRYERPLLVHIAALLLSMGQSLPPRSNDADFSELLNRLLEAEEERLLTSPINQGGARRGTAEERYAFGQVDECREALCVTTLTAPALRHVPELLMAAPVYSQNVPSTKLRAVSNTLYSLYPGRIRSIEPNQSPEPHLAAVEPDLIAAHLLAITRERPAIVSRLVTSDVIAGRPEYHAQLLRQLVLASDDYPDITDDLKMHLTSSLSALVRGGEWTVGTLSELLSDHLPELTSAVVDLTKHGKFDAARELSSAVTLAGLTGDDAFDQASAAALDHLLDSNIALDGLVASLATRATIHFEKYGDLHSKALAYTRLGNSLSKNGQNFEAVVAAERAVNLCEQLVAKSGDPYLPVLAIVVSDLGTYFSAVGRLEEASAITERAVRMWERLVAIDRSKYLSELASSVYNLAADLGERGRSSEALAIVERAVELYEELAESNPELHLSTLATAVSNFSLRLGETGRRSEAVAASERAVAIHEDLVLANRIEHLSALAMSLNNLAMHLSNAGRRTQGLVAIERTVDIYQELVDMNRMAHLQHLAAATLNLGVQLSQGSRRDEALVVSQRAVKLYEELAILNRAAYLPGLATSTSNLAVSLERSGQAEDGLESAEHAVELYKELVESEPMAYLSGLAGSLNNLGTKYGRSGRPAKALATFESAIEIYEDLVLNNRAAHLPGLASVLDNLASQLGKTGRHKKARSAFGKAVALHEELVQIDRSAHLHGLARSLHMSAELFERSQPSEALAILSRAAGIYEELAGSDRTAYLPDLANALRDISLPLANSGLPEKALRAIERAVEIYRELAVNDRSTFLPSLAWSLGLSAIVSQSLGAESAVVIDYFDRSIECFKTLAESNPSAFDSVVATVESVKHSFFPK